MRKDRLLKLADFLENNVDNDHFDLDYIKQESECGSVCCALGWIPTCFPRDNITLEEYSSFSGHYTSVVFNGFIDYEVGEEFFEIAWHESLYLFSPKYYPKNKKHRRYVINRIKNFVKRGGIHPGHELY